MKLTLTNNTGKNQAYYFTGREAIFEITQNDSVITSSVYGLQFAQVIIEGIFKKKNEKTYNWRAPTPPHASTLITLEPGQYEARAVIWMTFENYESIPQQVKKITIVDSL